ncbi:hypothetical protein [Zoogloea sp.]|uniref:hypothetical protein n=1 Tax=Zoogloea sp. TaxID=49181 RepID=UPI00260ADA03|nr:hypothetical protein [Zoogloea sp.]MDD3354387.1 hypothetical protein [Zoogloea sp.]
MNSRSCLAVGSVPSRSKGVVLAIVLVVLVVMMLGAVALLRSVDTSALLSGNLAFKRDTVNRSSIGLNVAFSQFAKTDFKLYGDSDAGCGAGSCTHASKWKSMNYWPRLLEADANGVPLVLKDATQFGSTFGIGPSTGDSTSKEEVKVRFLIERMCTDYGTSDERKCVLSNETAVGGDTRGGNLGSVALPLYRVTIRTDGPRNTQTYVQAIVTTRVR